LREFAARIEVGQQLQRAAKARVRVLDVPPALMGHRLQAAALGDADMMAAGLSRGGALPRQPERLLEGSVVEGITGELAEGGCHRHVVPKLPPTIETAPLQGPGLADILLGEKHVAEVVEDLVGEPVLTQPLVNCQRGLAMVDRTGVVTGGPSG